MLISGEKCSLGVDFFVKLLKNDRHLFTLFTNFYHFAKKGVDSGKYFDYTYRMPCKAR